MVRTQQPVFDMQSLLFKNLLLNGRIVVFDVFDVFDLLDFRTYCHEGTPNV